MRPFECAVIGGGPAGMAAALYLARFQRKTALFHFGTPRVYWAPRINNLLGYPEGITGRALLKKYERHLALYPHLKRIRAEVHVKKVANGFEITTKRGARYFAKKVILACGVTDVHPSIPEFASLRKRGLLRYCSVCDGYEMRKKKVAVIARSNADIPKALFIRHWVKEMTLLVPSSLRLSPLHARKLQEKKIAVLRANFFDLVPRSVKEAITVSIENYRPSDYAIAYIELGCHVNSSAFRFIRGLRKSEAGFIEASAEQRTSVRGLYAIGDCVNRLGQVSVALGQAAIAATNVHDELL